MVCKGLLRTSRSVLQRLVKAFRCVEFWEGVKSCMVNILMVQQELLNEEMVH